MVHVFALLLYIGLADDRKLVSDDMLFRKLETCNTKDFGLAYCIPKLVDPEKVRIY